MTLFPIRRPQIGLGIGRRTICAVEIGRDWRSGWRGLRLRQCRSRVLLTELVHPSATKPNVSHVTALSDQLQALLDGRRSLSVALSLPDLCGRAALFDFKALPQKAAEREALVRWRFQQEFDWPADNARIAYRVFRTAPAQFRALAVAIRLDILEQYERACEEAGLWPVSVGLASFRLFDLCRPAMKAVARSDELFFAYIAEGCFAFVAIRQGTPTFLRIKPIRDGEAGDVTISSGHLADELVATLQFYQDLHPHRGAGARPRPVRDLFLLGDASLPPMIDRSALESLDVQIVPLGSDDPSLLRNLHTTGSLPACSLPALAGVLEG